MSASSQVAATANPSIIASLASDRGGKQGASGANSGFSAVLQDLTASDAPPSTTTPVQDGKNDEPLSTPTAAKRGKGDANKSGAGDDEADPGDDTTQTLDLKAQLSLDAAATIAAIVGASMGSSTLASTQKSGSGVIGALPTNGSSAKYLTAQLNKQEISSSAQPGGAIMPSDSASLTLTQTSSVAPAVVDVQVQRARTYLGVGGAAENFKSNASPPASTEVGAAKVATVASSSEKAASAGDRQASGDGAAKGETAADGGAGQGQNRRSGADDGLAIDGSALVASAQSSASAFGTASIDLDQLADVLADQATTLAAGAQAASGGGATSASPVKELDVNLNPAELGSLTVKMRIANGNLSVVIEAQKSSTAKLIDSERDAIVARLASADQPIASVVVKTTENAPTQSENGNGTGSATPQQGGAQSGAAGDTGGHARSSRGHAEQGQGRARSNNDGAPGHDRSGDIFV